MRIFAQLEIRLLEVDCGFLKKLVQTYQKAPISPINSPTVLLSSNL